MKFDKTTLEALRTKCRNGETIIVQFNERCESVMSEACVDDGMKASIMRVEREGSDDTNRECYNIVFDLSPFDEFNRRFEKAVYYDASGKACLTAREAGYYVPQEAWIFREGDEIPYDIVASTV